MKSYGDEARDFHDKEMPKVGYNYICLAVMLIDSENYNAQVLLKECKYIEIKLTISSDKSDGE